MIVWKCSLLCAGILALVGCKSAATKPPTPATDDTTVTRVYDVRDLIVQVPNFAPDSTGHQATTQPTQTREELVHDLITSITSSIDPLSWRENAGNFGLIQELKGQLIVTQIPTNHERIIQKLEQLREKTAIQVTFEARFIVSNEFEKRLTGGKKHWIALSDKNAELWPGFLTADAAKELARATQRNIESFLITAPRMTLFNGQRAYVVVSKQTAYVSDLHKEGDEIKPEISIIDSGVLVDCRAKVTDDLKFVTLTLHPRLTSLIGINPVPWPGGKEHLIQVPETVTNDLHTTITMPNDRTAVYKLRPRHSGPATQPANDPAVFLLIRPRIIVQREVDAQPQARRD